MWTVGDVAATVAAASRPACSTTVSRPGDRVLLMMRNRPDFHWFDLAAQFLRATPVSIYNSSSPEEIQYLAEHAEAEIAIVEDAGFLERILEGPRRAAAAASRSTSSTRRTTALPDGVAPAAELMAQGTARPRELAAEATDPTDIATLIYTSGTTGPPKGVMISQYNVVYTVEQLRRCIDFDDFVGKRVVSATCRWRTSPSG